MRLIDKKEHCQTCKSKCDIFFTAKEMNLRHELMPLHLAYKKHQTICKQNTPITHAINLLEGNAKMFVDGLHGKNIILNILIPNNYIGITAVFGLQDYVYNVESLSACQTCHVDIELVRKMYHNNMAFQLKLNQAFGTTVTSIMGKIISLNQKQIRAKVADSLIYLSQLYENNHFALPITRKELGELSAITGENAVRVLTEFSKEGIIKLNGKEVIILKPEVLHKINSLG